MGINLQNYAIGDYLPLGGGTLTGLLTTASAGINFGADVNLSRENANIAAFASGDVLATDAIWARPVDGQTMLLVARNTAGQTQTVAQVTGNATVANSYFEIVKNLVADGAVLIGSSTSYGLNNSLIQVNSTTDLVGISIHEWLPGGVALMNFHSSRGTALGDYAALVGGEDIARIRFFGSDGTNWQSAATIYVGVTGIVGDNRVPGLMEFHLYSDAASSVDTTVMSMTATGVAIPVGLCAFSVTTPVAQQVGCAIPTDLATAITAITALRAALNAYGLTTVV